MGYLSEDLQKKALLKIRTAAILKRKNWFLRLMEKLLLKSESANNKLNKKAQSWMQGRRLVWAQFNKRKQEFEKDAYVALMQENFDLILCHDSKAINIAAKIAKEQNAVLGFDLVEMTFANLRGFEPGPSTRRKLRRKENKIGNATFIISGDPYLSKDFKTRHPQANPVLILNGQEVNYDEPKETIRAMMGDTSNRPIVLYIGVVAVQRGIEQIIDAFSQIKTDALLAIVGPGNASYRDELRTRIVDNGLGSQAFLLDGVPEAEVVPLASTATVGISPISAKTGNAGLVLNNKMFQYLAAGLPILSTDVPGPGGFIKKHGIGYIYQDGDTEDLTRVIDKSLDEIVNNPSISKNLDETARTYTWESQREKLVDYIHEIERKSGLDRGK